MRGFGSKCATGQSGSVDQPAVITTDDGRRTQLWEASESSSSLFQTHWLVVRLPSWMVLAAVLHRDPPEVIAGSLSLSQSEAGFPVIEATPPLGLSTESGEGEGPPLTIGDAAPAPDQVDMNPNSRMVMLWVESCQGYGELSSSGKYARRCLDRSLSAEIYGDLRFVKEVYEGLEVRAVTVSGQP